MKKIISTLLVCVLLVGCVFTLASCGMVSGKYEAEIMGVKTSYTFSLNKVTYETKATVLGVVTSTTMEGTYKIEENDDGDSEITFTWTSKNGEELDEAETATFAFSDVVKDDVKYVKIGLVEYKKVD